MTKSTYFNKHWDESFIDKGPNAQIDDSDSDLVERKSMNQAEIIPDDVFSVDSPSDQQFESNAPGTSAMDSAL